MSLFICAFKRMDDGGTADDLNGKKTKQYNGHCVCVCVYGFQPFIIPHMNFDKFIYH